MEANLKDWVIDVILDKLPEYEGTECWGAEIAWNILETYNIDGSYTYSTYKAKEWVKAHFDELGEAVEQYEDVFGERDSLPNVFDNPEAFQVCILLLLADYYIQNCPYIIEHSDEELIIDEKLIKTLSNWLEYQKGGYGDLLTIYDREEEEC